MIIPRPFPDELAITHLFRFLVANNYDKADLFNEKIAFARTLKPLRPENAEHAWSEIHTHAILAYLCDISPQEYRAKHTLLMLTRDWPRVLERAPVKESQTAVYTLAELYEYSPSQHWAFRLCPQCRNEDLDRYGMSYWHREHHLPGIDICVTHGTALHLANFSQAYRAPNPACVDGVEVSAELVDAQHHPLIKRYRTLLLTALKNSTTVRYEIGGEKAKARALDLGFWPYKSSFPQLLSLGSIADFICPKLPPTWVRDHLFHAHNQPHEISSRNNYYVELGRIEHPSALKPAFLLLILATLFESTDEVCSFLFAEPTNKNLASETELYDALA